MRVARVPIISASVSANNFSHPENRWLVENGGTRVVYGVVFFPILFPAGIFICYGLEFRLVCL